MKYLGIDFGSKRVGIAVSDETGRLAFPHSVIPNNDGLVEKILEIVKRENIEEIVVGESRDFKNIPNKIMEKIEEFKAVLEEKTKLKILFEPEFMTSSQAERGIMSRRPDTQSIRGTGSRLKSREKNDMHDASAAAIILQSFLDKKHPVL
ncbi:MAG: hypothetical protein A3E02_02330 [Candidatus Zambryskibacteria bacterium RIFCSPHIGHO2_12_FULL_38_34]|uniref:Putative pre-16S rRNA nuclease n=1 Tax=Candidatus Zambryskibacteria bacterium RIFCSPLOWO2_12_FULL_39_16 TaxID=1802775 RepID=A0A1G2USA7_9BACT|nr:MAG: hypothetical protein A3D37_00570 [Candidatus Zambryskibacteria bacterium RIFCSPHIGHO2_02_FULL_38_22]OHA97829.1 MAG: hypothetical protein A3E02_02330 [Candidatus Zambryskibacteria bacterium RIFCSPHIGHO2_12_FULL_38_34]OHB08604.1 MAG: hypothetical protein A3I19_00630 [Candidatus Zambryskibacteria bacterium RIFCSPLOWO2_02_FULL_38_13]OHB12236.1 MAG: hypothetical protein A3G46_01270 [Candidatus Zambryskibacteria bacterium RIFCSPLOWO2_12_FULL_39_16]